MLISTEPAQRCYDTVIIGGGFYGCYLASHLAAQGEHVLICEMNSDVMRRASAVNQARVHTGFHYPRSYVTALRSLQNHQRFVQDFQPAICQDFKMLYAIARHGTKVSSERFYGMFSSMNAPIRQASSTQQAIFDGDAIDGVFACTEYAFDYERLRSIQLSRMADLSIEISFNTKVTQLSENGYQGITLSLANGRSVSCGRVFNVSYSMLNAVLKASGIAPIALKHELVEIALVDRPSYLNGIGVTVMDGPFFSMMPWPAADAYSLTHVRHTPHFSWTDEMTSEDAYAFAENLSVSTRWKHMAAAATHFYASKEPIRWKQSLYDVKTIPTKNERDDGRPILLVKHGEVPGLFSVLGSKIDNVYDLIEAV